MGLILQLGMDGKLRKQWSMDEAKEHGIATCGRHTCNYVSTLPDSPIFFSSTYSALPERLYFFPHVNMMSMSGDQEHISPAGESILVRNRPCTRSPRMRLTSWWPCTVRRPWRSVTFRVAGFGSPFPCVNTTSTDQTTSHSSRFPSLFVADRSEKFQPRVPLALEFIRCGFFPSVFLLVFPWEKHHKGGH
jgi:hypothetical protein